MENAESNENGSNEIKNCPLRSLQSIWFVLVIVALNNSETHCEMVQVLVTCNLLLAPSEGQLSTRCKEQQVS